MDRDEFKCISVLAYDYAPYDLADHLADVMAETFPDGRSIWGLSGMELARLAVNHYPGGAMGLQFALMGLAMSEHEQRYLQELRAAAAHIRDRGALVTDPDEPGWFGVDSSKLSPEFCSYYSGLVSAGYANGFI